MKRILLTLISALLLSTVAFAQKGLNCYPVFQGKIVPWKNMIVTEARGHTISEYRLSYYRGVSFKASDELAAKVASLVEQDAARALVKESEKVEGLLTYALVQPKSEGSINRYVCYQARKVEDGWMLTLMYLEGPATLDDLKNMFEKQ
ncbi:MAG: DUF6108 family protein [Bacteroidales bacterium]|nr:DUF6108 family protein [Bacteroidales bacterium]MDT3356934.1 DUF6108 family protein [Bacteroidota bacterium]